MKSTRKFPKQRQETAKEMEGGGDSRGREAVAVAVVPVGGGAVGGGGRRALRRRGGGGTAAVADADGGAVRRLVLRGPRPAGRHLHALYFSSASASASGASYRASSSKASPQPQSTSGPSSPRVQRQQVTAASVEANPATRPQIENATGRRRLEGPSSELRIPGPPSSRRGERVDKRSKPPAMRAV
jgi:hypothetical protein